MSRSLRDPVEISIDEVYAQVAQAGWRRAEALCRAARRAGHLAIGADAGANAWLGGKVALVVLAEDARAAANLHWVHDAQRDGRIVVGPPKAVLGCWCGQDTVAVVAITNSGMAIALARAMAIARLPDRALSNREAEKGTEVG
jgi:ribosomal protein L7Ae-like RNA K-turn-binding protein